MSARILRIAIVIGLLIAVGAFFYATGGLSEDMFFIGAPYLLMFFLTYFGRSLRNCWVLPVGLSLPWVLGLLAYASFFFSPLLIPATAGLRKS